MHVADATWGDERSDGLRLPCGLLFHVTELRARGRQDGRLEDRVEDRASVALIVERPPRSAQAGAGRRSEMSITVLKVPAFPLRDKATNEYFTTVVGRRHQARGERVELDRGLCPAAA